MFDIGWMELMVVGMVALLVVGPKELPGLLRTLGKYAGMLKKQAQEFRAQFDEAIQDSEFQDIKKDFESVGEEASASMQDVEASVREDLDEVDVEFDKEVNLDEDLYNEEAEGASAEGSSVSVDDDVGTSSQSTATSAASSNGSDTPVNGSASSTADTEVNGAGKTAAQTGSNDTSTSSSTPSSTPSVAAEGKG